MPEPYNPIVRTFCRFRSGLLRHVDVDRHEVRPETELEWLLPVEARKDVWRELRAHGLRLPPLELSAQDIRRNTWHVLRVVVAIAAAVGFRRWSLSLLIIPFWVAAVWQSRHRAVCLPHYLRTVGELVIYATCFGEHKQSGYRWTRSEVALKVRLVIAESTGLPLDEIRPETTFAEIERAVC